MTSKSKKIIWYTILIISIALIITAFVVFIYPQIKFKKKIEDVRSQVSSEVSDNSSTESKVVETPVNFDELHQTNPEIYGWINIPGTVIDYPLLNRPDDNNFYLNHNFQAKSASYGSIFIENRNSTDMNDFNTLIYGHNMLNGTMFGQLKKFRNATFFNENQYINIYLPGTILKYQIFAAYIYDDRHILRSFDFSNESIRSAYIDMIFSQRNMSSHIRNDVNVTEKDKIITLSTCTSVETERYLVQGVLIYDSRKEG